MFKTVQAFLPVYTSPNLSNIQPGNGLSTSSCVHILRDHCFHTFSLRLHRLQIIYALLNTALSFHSRATGAGSLLQHELHVREGPKQLHQLPRPALATDSGEAKVCMWFCNQASVLLLCFAGEGTMDCGEAVELGNQDGRYCAWLLSRALKG